MLKTWISQLAQLVRDLKTLRPHLRPNRWLVLGAMAMASLSALFEGVGIGLLIPMIALLQGDVEAALKGRFLKWLPELWPNQSPTSYVLLFCGLVFAALLAKNVIFFGYQILLTAFSRRVGLNLRDAFFRHLQRVSLHVFEERKAGELNNVFFGEIGRTQATLEFFLLCLQRLSVLTLYFVMLLLLSWQFTLATLALAALIGTLSSRIQVNLARGGALRTSAYREITGYVLGVFSGIRLVRATNAQQTVEAGFHDRSHHLAAVERRAALLSQSLGPFTEVIAVAGMMGLIAGAYVWLIQPGRLGSSSLMVIGLILIRLLPLVNQIYGLTGQLSLYAAGVNEVIRWLAIPQFPGRPFGDRDFSGVRRAIRLENVGFTYPNGTAALRGVSLEIPAGQTVALVGASGSGKSTLATLLLRLREPTSGRITVDGVDYWEFSATSWHGQLGIVEQEAFLFNDTIRNNITFGCPDATPERIAEAVRVAHLQDVIAELPKGLETVVGERGTMLSGGQKQRLAIARAIVRNPRLLLLDEATSALDNYSERQVQAALDDARRGRTSVVIAHRLSTIRNADLIAVMDRGEIVETGTWTELERRGGTFSRLLAAAGGAAAARPSGSPLFTAA